MIRWARGPGTSRFPSLWRGLKVGFAPCITGAGRNVPDFAFGRFPFAFTGSGAAFSTGFSPIGASVQFAGNAALAQTATNAPCKFLANSVYDEFSIQAYFRYTHSGSAKESTIFWSDNATVASSYYGYRLYVDNNTDKLKLMVANGDNMVTVSPTYYTSNTTLTGGKWYHVNIVWTGLGRDGALVDLALFFIEGVDDGYLTITNSVPSGVEEYCSHLGTQVPRIGATLNSIAPDIQVAMVNVWNRALAVREIATQAADPRAMFRRRRFVGAKAPRLITIGGAAFRRMDTQLSG